MHNNGHDPERARAALWCLDAGAERAEWVRAAMAAKAAGLAFDDFDLWSATAGNYAGKADCAAVWRSVKDDGGIGPGTLFHLARNAGWQDDASADYQRPPMPTKAAQSPAAAPVAERQGADPAALWNACKPAAAAHWYVAKKGGNPDGLRTYHGPLMIAGQSCDGALVLPCRTLDGKLASLQFVTEAGKLFLPGCKLPPDACLVLGTIEPGRAVYLVEGIGQAWSANKATGCAAVVAFGWGRVAQVAKAIQTRHPAARLVLVPDGGKEQQAAEIARALDCQYIELPPGTPRNGDINDAEQSEGADAVRRLLESPKSAPQRFRLMSADELAALPPVRWRIRGVIPEEGIGAFYGPPGSGKSFLVLDALAAIAAGRPWFGYRVKAVPVLYIALEGERGISQRVRAHRIRHGTADGMHFLAAPLDLRKTEDRADIVRAAKASGLAGGVLCLDTLAASAPGMDENASADMGEIIAALKAVQAELGGCVLAVHHAGKDAARGMRGHSSLLGALDCVIEVSREADRREWRTAKAKDGEDGEAHAFRLAVVELGTDDDGEPETSCVVEPAERTAEGMRRVALPGGGNMRLAFDAIGAALKDARTYGQASAPPGRPCLELEAAITAAASRLPCDPKRRRERAQSAITGLVSRGNLEHQEGWLWLP